MLRVAIRLHANLFGGATNRLCTLSIAAGSTIAGVSSVSYVGGTPSFLDGSTTSPVPYVQSRQAPELTAYIDVTGFTVGTLYAIRLRYTPTTNGGYNGVRMWSLQECPRSTLDIVGDPTNEPGLDEAEPDIRNRIRTGTTGTNGGMLRLASELDIARTKHRRHLQISCPSSGTYANISPFSSMGGVSSYWTVNSTTETNPDWRAPAGQNILLRARPRKLYQSTPGNNYRFAAIYAFNPGWADFTNSYLKAQSDSTNTGGVISTTTALPLTNTGALTTFVVGSVGGHGTSIDGNSPFAPIEENSFIAITADNPVTTSAECRLLCLALIEEET